MTYWTPDEDVRLRELRAQGMPYLQIARVMGRTARACGIRISKLNELERERSAGIRRRPLRGFSDQEVADLLRMREVEHKSFTDIDAALGRRNGGCKTKYRQLRGGDVGSVPRRSPEAPSLVVPADCIADRERRRALAHPTITAALLGDPLPGRSALDLRGRL